MLQHDHLGKKLFGGGVVLVLIVVATLVFLSLSKHRRVVDQRAHLEEVKKAGPAIEVARATRPPPTRQLALVGEARPYLATSLYSRVSGFVTEVLVDKGDVVKEGDLLAVIESPETDRAYLAALADSQNKARIADRSKALRKRNLISQQDADQAVYTADIAKATFETQEVLKSYERLIAPFSGTIVARYIDPGALVQNASTSQQSSPAIFDIAETDVLRVYGYVEQRDASLIHPGLDATITLPGQREPLIRAKIKRTAGALDPKTRTLLTEVDIENPRGEIVAGSFVELDLSIPNPNVLEVPIKALVTVADKSTVPIVKPDQTLHFQPVVTAGSDGKSVRIVSGLEEGQEVALNASIYSEGQKVRVLGSEQAGQVAR